MKKVFNILFLAVALVFSFILTENLNILRFVVPAVMLGVAANLITIFRHSFKSQQ